MERFTREEERDIEIEANIFAVYLLMPTPIFLPYLEKMGISLDDDETLARAARKFRVPLGALMFRMMLEMRIR